MIWKAIAVSLLGAALVSGHAISEQKVIKYFRGHHGQLEHIGEQKPEHHEEYAWAYPAYEFAYKVEDPHTHDFKGQQESRDGDVVKGEYWLLQPDGRKRIVKYHADKHSGFKADVLYEGKAHHPPQEVKHNIPHKPHVEHKIVVEHKPEIKLPERRESESERREPERREPGRREPERREPARREPARREPERREPERREPERREPERREPETREPERRESERRREPERWEPEKRKPERWESEMREPERREPERIEIRKGPKVIKIQQKIIHVVPKHEEKHKEPKEVRIVHWPRHESRERVQEREQEREEEREEQREEERERERRREPEREVREPYYGHRRYYRHSKSQQ